MCRLVLRGKFSEDHPIACGIPLKDPNRANCSITPNAVKALLQYTALRMRGSNGIEHDTLTQGAGALNGNGAIELARVIDTTRKVGSFWLQSAISPSTR